MRGRAGSANVEGRSYIARHTVTRKGQASARSLYTLVDCKLPEGPTARRRGAKVGRYREPVRK